MKNVVCYLLLATLFGFMTVKSSYSNAQCNTNVSICTPGTAGPFTFSVPGTPVSSCLDFFGPGVGYIMLNITSSGPLNMLINGNASTGFLDVAVFNIPNGVPPCTAIQNSANEIGCNYADFSNGCNQFGTSFPCTSTVPSPNVVAGQTLMIVVENWSGSSSTFTLQLGPPPGAQTGPPNPTINPAGPFCSTSAPVQLTAVNSGGTWSGPGTSSSGVFNPATAGPGVHTINYSIGAAPCNASSSTTITVNAPGPISVTPSAPSICTGGSVSLTASGASGYAWSPATGLSSTSGATVTASPTSTTTYTVSSSPPGCKTPANVTVTVNPLPNANAGGAQVITCASPTVTLNGSSSTSGASYSWSGPGIVSGGNTATPTVNAPGTYTLTVTSPAGCTKTATVNVTQNITPPNASAGSPQTITCGTTTATLNGSSSTSGATFSWSGPGIVSGGNTATPTVNAAGTYTLTVTNPANGCTATATVTVTNASAVPNANAGSPQTLTCTTTSVVLNGSSSSSPVSYSWSGPGIVSGGNTATPTVNAAGTYTLTVTNTSSGCTNTATVNVTLNNTPPNANAGPPKTLTCTTTSVTLNGSSSTSGATFSWNGPGIVSGGNSATPTVNAAGTYTLTVTNPANGCTNTSTVNVTLNNTPPNANAGTPQTLTCTTTSVTLNGSSTTSGATFSWSGPGIVSGGNSATPTVNAAGTYTVTVTNPANGCTNTATVNVTLSNTPPNANAGTPQTLTCTATSVTLNGSSTTSGATFSWSGPGIVSGGNTATPTVNAAGTYTVTVTNPANGCTATATVNVTLNNTPPNANAGTPQTLTCSTTSVTLNGSSSTTGATFSWSGPGIVSGGNSATPTVNAAGTYTVTVTNPANGCTATATVNVTLNNTPPNANAGTPQTLTCTTTSVTLNGSSSTTGATFSWNGPGIVSGGNSTTPTVNAAGTYTLTVTNPANGCTNTATVNVTLNNTPPNANAGTPQTLDCGVTSLTLNGSSTTSGATFSWSGPGIVSGGNTATPTVNAPGTYTLTVTNPANGCTNTATVSVTNSTAIPNANAGTPQTLTCTTTSLTLNGSSSTSGVNYSWSGPGIVSGGNSATPTVNAPGTYTLTVTDPANSCSNTSTVAITLNNTPPNANAGTPQTLTCTTTSVTLSGSSTTSGATFSWSGPGIVSGGNTATPTVNAPGTYTLTITDPTNGCTTTSTVTINQNTTAPDANAGTSQTLTCAVTSVTLNGSSTTSGGTYSWSGPGIVSGGSLLNPTVNAPGNYTLTVTDPANGCTATSTVAVNQNVSVPNANAGQDDILNCSVTSLTLNGSSSTTGATFSWNGPGIVSGGNTATPTINVAGTYTLTVTDPSNGCSQTDNVLINSDPVAPNVDAGPDLVLNCNAPTGMLSGNSTTNGVSYSWSGPGITGASNTQTISVNAGGNYYLTVTDPSNGCTNSDLAVVTEDLTPPSANAGADVTLNCNAPTSTLNGSSATQGVNYSWSGPGIVSGGNTATPSVNAAGTYTLTVTNPTSGCTNTDQVVVNADLNAPAVTFRADTLLGCTPLLVNFIETNNQQGMIYNWTFGDGGTDNSGASVSHTYTAEGCYDVGLTVTDPSNGCSTVQNQLSYICVFGVPNANFTATPQTVDQADGIVFFNNLSTNATSYVWDFGDGTSGTSTNSNHDYSGSTGTYQVMLTASNNDVCFDSVILEISVIEPIVFYVPNTFTPDNDMYNQTFGPVITSGIDIYNFTFYIYNRWGEVIWESHDPSVGWDGTYAGEVVKEGVYIWTMRIKDKKVDKYFDYEGHVNLIR